MLKWWDSAAEVSRCFLVSVWDLSAGGFVTGVIACRGKEEDREHRWETAEFHRPGSTWPPIPVRVRVRVRVPYSRVRVRVKVRVQCVISPSRFNFLFVFFLLLLCSLSLSLFYFKFFYAHSFSWHLLDLAVVMLLGQSQAGLLLWSLLLFWLLLSSPPQLQPAAWGHV